MSLISKRLSYRAASYHGAHVEPGTLEKAKKLGFNAIELQVEGDTIKGLEKLQHKENQTGLMKKIHGLGMKVAVWVHELSSYEAEKYGSPEIANQALWKLIAERYRYICSDLLPDADYLVLTVVETQYNITDGAILTKLVDVINREARQAGKQLIFRSFVWAPSELDGVVKALKNMSSDIWFHTKYVPQDWHFRSIDNPLIGQFPDHNEIVEYGIAGEYMRNRHLLSFVAPDIAVRQQKWLRKGIEGVSVRVNRFGDGDSNSAFDSFQECNLWALMPFTLGVECSVEERLHDYAEAKFGKDAAPVVAEALWNTGEVNMEALYVENMTFGDPRETIPADSTFELQATIERLRNRWKQDIKIPEGLDLKIAPVIPYDESEDFLHRNPFNKNYAPFLWDASYKPRYNKIRCGDPEVIKRKENSYRRARAMALESLDLIEGSNDLFEEDEAYRFLHWRLSENLWHLDAMCSCALAWLNATRTLYANDEIEKAERWNEVEDWLKKIEKLDKQKEGETTKIRWNDRVRDLQRGSYLDLKSFLKKFTKLWDNAEAPMLG